MGTEAGVINARGSHSLAAEAGRGPRRSRTCEPTVPAPRGFHRPVNSSGRREVSYFESRLAREFVGGGLSGSHHGDYPSAPPRIRLRIFISGLLPSLLFGRCRKGRTFSPAQSVTEQQLHRMLKLWVIVRQVLHECRTAVPEYRALLFRLVAALSRPCPTEQQKSLMPWSDVASVPRHRRCATLAT